MSSYETDKKMNMEITDINDAAAMAKMIDDMMNSGVSRLKVKESEDMTEGQLLKEYHHGRCDIGSPWSCGKSFDVLE